MRGNEWWMESYTRRGVLLKYWLPCICKYKIGIGQGSDWKRKADRKHKPRCEVFFNINYLVLDNRGRGKLAQCW